MCRFCFIYAHWSVHFPTTSYSHLKFASDNAGLKENNDLLVARADDLGRRLHNKTRQANRARVSADTLRDALGRSKHARAIQAGRLERRKRDGIEKALTEVRLGLTKRWMKGKGGTFTEPSREIF
ncbi:hypothetical protein B0H17DRAFT_1146300 [Mycena rosella]|uniref:Uncharacterized protein n=1 Tax=Mycena rosella TaxID=1033263 RepID=A0AAD7CP64_MYCRO|nr:hypothetical protein B0H17DRAFT_1146300 [Mycena rosella]